MADKPRFAGQAPQRGTQDGARSAAQEVSAEAALSRLSLNTATVRPLDAVAGPDLVAMADACARAGVPWIAPWRQQFKQTPVSTAARAIRDAGLKVSSLCRGGFFPAATDEVRRANVEDNLRAVDEAAELGTDVLVLVCGGVVGKDTAGSRQMVEDGIAAVLPHAAERGVRLGIEPLHPMFAADRSVITTLAEASAMTERLASPWVGAVVDVYHVWWDPQIDASIEAAKEHTLGFHVNDWVVPLPDVLAGRGMMGDGVIDLRGLREAVDAVGYSGPIEVEIFNQALWARPMDEVLALLKERYLQTVFSAAWT